MTLRDHDTIAPQDPADDDKGLQPRLAVASPADETTADEDGPDGPSSGIEPTPTAVRALQTRSRLAQAMKDAPPISVILIVEDDQRDSNRLASTLRSIFGYEIAIKQCRTLGTALDSMLEQQPDLLFLDDRLGPVDKAERSVPFLRSAKCTAPIILVSGHVDRRRRADFFKLGISDVIDKDELDSTSICEAVINSLKRKR